MSTTTNSGVWLCFLGVLTLVVVAGLARFGISGDGVVLVPLSGLFFTLAASRRIVRRRPDEDWAGRLLVVGFVAKLLAAYLRYYTLTVTYNSAGDATDYDKYGREFAKAWSTGTAVPVLRDLHETNFVRWFTGVVYYLFGSNLLTGTFVFALLALIGSYLWYRATADAVPIIDKKLYLCFVLFAPSIAFWPAEVGKEALMQFGLGVVAFATALLLQQRLFPALLVGFGGGWLLWIVRPHLLAFVTIAAGAAYLAGRVRRTDGRRAGFLTRPIGIVLIAFLAAFAVGQGAKFLGIQSLSASSIQAELDQTTAQSAQGGSSFDNGGHSLNPINYPRDAVTVLLRPFPWETSGGLQLLASLEGTALAALLMLRFSSLRRGFARSREHPFLMFTWVLTGLYCIAFSSFANFGLLVRERSLVLPAVCVVLCVKAVEEPSRPSPHTPVGSRRRA